MIGKHSSIHMGGTPPLPTAKDLVIRAYVETKHQGEPAFLGRFKLLIRSNPQCQDPVYEHYASAMLRSFLRTKSAYLNNENRAKDARDKKVQEATEKKVRLALLLMVMPNGKLMRDCTGGEMAMFGKGYVRIAERVGPDRKVGDVLGEDEVYRLMKMPK
jgi:hypothetical protein